MLRLLLPLAYPLFAIGDLHAQRSLLDQLPPDQDAYAFRLVGFGDEFTQLELPGGGAVQGLARIGTRLWVARGKDLFGLGWPGLEQQVKVAAPQSLVALSADERFLYALQADAVLVLDPHAGQVVRTVPFVVEDRKPAVAMVHHAGQLRVLMDQRLIAVDLQTGRGVGDAQLWRSRVHWLASDGHHMWAGAEQLCGRLEPSRRERDGLRMASVFTWPWSVRNSAATWVDGRLLLAADHRDERSAEHFVCGLVTIAPDIAEALSLHLYAGDNGTVKYELGPKPLFIRDKLAAELRRIAADPSSMVPGVDGKPRLLPVVIKAYPAVAVRDLTAAWDIVVAAGFADVRSPAQEQWVREQARVKAAAAGRK